jgi:hypothetical protein
MKKLKRSGVVVHVYNPSTQRLVQEEHEFEDNLGCIVRPCLHLKNERNEEGQKTGK